MQIELTPAEEARLREEEASRGARPQDLAAQMVRMHLIQGVPEDPRAYARTPEKREHTGEDPLGGMVRTSSLSAPGARTLFGLEVPAALAPLADEIERSREILDLEDNFDGGGSAAYSQETWQGATRFLLANAIAAREWLALVPPVPNITPGPNGSIDIFWQSGSQELLLNVPADPSARASYYGDDTDASIMKGWLTPADRNSTLLLLLDWRAVPRRRLHEALGS